MAHALSVEEIRLLLDSPLARSRTSEPVSPLHHALQCAWMAQQDRASSSLIAAALLHDLGHLLDGDRSDHGRYADKTDDDDCHEHMVLPYLLLFPASVTEPIRLHVDAKRYLCRRDYSEALSQESVRSLNIQGGPMDDKAARTFLREPYAARSIALRLWDDRAKVPDLTTPPLEHFIDILLPLCGEPEDATAKI